MHEKNDVRQQQNEITENLCLRHYVPYTQAGVADGGHGDQQFGLLVGFNTIWWDTGRSWRGESVHSSNKSICSQSWLQKRVEERDHAVDSKMTL